MGEKLKNTTYIANTLTKPVVTGVDSLLKTGLFEAVPNLNLGNWANVYGGLAFGALHFLGKISNRIEDSKFSRLFKLAGTGLYTGQFVYDLVHLSNGSWEYLPKSVLDGLMLYSLGKDTIESYGTRKLENDLHF